MSVDVVYTAESTATGGGRTGQVRSSDGALDLLTRPPREAGGDGDGVNPELLFSAGYAACFLGALRKAARTGGILLDENSTVTARIGFGKDSEGGFGLTAMLRGHLPGLDQHTAEELMNQAHRVCPYSKATRGNIAVSLLATI